MIFDLKGKRRRVVQGTYLTLAVLMGGGLILFGIGGGSLNGGLLDAFKGGGGGGGSADKATQKRIDAAQRRLAVNPQDRAALSEIVTDYYRLASSTADPQTGTYSSEGKQDLQKASDAWQRYINSNPAKPDATLANYMMQVYSQLGLNRPAYAQKAAEIVAADQNNYTAYVRLVGFATLAGDKRTADLAAAKALELAPKSQRGSVKQLLKQARAAGAATSVQSGATGASGG